MTGLFDNFDFSLLDAPSFKEDAVREEIIAPVLAHLDFSASSKKRTVLRELKLASPYLKHGAANKTLISYYPDYVLKVNNQVVLVLDAKAPNKNIRTGEHVQQVRSYAMHEDMLSAFALCNGADWTFFRLDDKIPSLIVTTKEIENHLDKILAFILPSNLASTPRISEQRYGDEWYQNKRLPEIIAKPRKQASKIHFGVHGYFTKQSWDIVNRHIAHFTQTGDTVLDSYGGSGVTLIEALRQKRQAIHVDLNPLSVFWMESILAPTDLLLLKQASDKIIKQFAKQVSTTTLADVETVLPENLPLLSKGADAKHLHDIFSKKQLTELGLLKKLILQVKNKAMRHSLLLAFSSTVTQNNLTYHTSSTNEGSLYGGDSGIFRYYRYRIAPKPTYVDIKKSFQNKVKHVINAKKEFFLSVNAQEAESSRIIKGDATDLKGEGIADESIDYIYTDPPYGKKIEYLDLSVMWNAWLDLKVSDDDYQKEAIEGGHVQKSREQYGSMIVKSLEEMFRVLKWNRWMSFVFQHQDPYYWHLIVENAEKMGFEFFGTTKQDNGQTSFKKRKNPFSVLSGQLIIHFIKKKNPKTRMKFDLGTNVEKLISNNVEAIIAENNGANINDINNSLVQNGLELGFLDKLKKYGDITPYLQNNFDYDRETDKYVLKPNAKFTTTLPITKRVKYFTISYLRRNNRNGVYPDFDDIVKDIIPLLKNGTTPENQTILSVLEEIAYPDNKNGYHLNEGTQTRFL